MKLLRGFIRFVDAVNYRVGRVAMYGIFAMMAILLWSSISKTFFNPSLWTLEMAQFAMVAYYILGGPYSIQLGSNVRMDLLYGGWSPRRKAAVDVITVLFLIFYLGCLLWGAVGSTAYSLGYYGSEPFSFFGNLISGFATGGAEGAGDVLGRPERSPTAWRPYLWPIKTIMIFGFTLMLFQALSELCKDILRLGGKEVPDVL
ncbi:MAG: TRAP transporter small permease subunit [Rhodobacteraceae bacterium]|nr:TRAP transporter small permease subunit [Paracoccaceae bacterium]